MAVDGHPFSNEMLDSRRARQRLDLAYLPDHWVRGGAAVGAPRTERAALIEHELRLLADGISGELKEILAARHTDGDVRRFLNTATKPRGMSGGVLDVLEPALGTSTSHIAVPDKTMHVLNAWILLVTTADVLAGDYRDDRLPA